MMSLYNQVLIYQLHKNLLQWATKNNKSIGGLVGNKDFEIYIRERENCFMRNNDHLKSASRIIFFEKKNECSHAYSNWNKNREENNLMVNLNKEQIHLYNNYYC